MRGGGRPRLSPTGSATGGARVRGAAFDAADPVSVAALLSGATHVLNCVGPFYRYGPPLLAAAIDAGAHYVDVCDDLDPTLAMLGLDGRAREAGVCALIGMGNSPGLANVLVRYAADQLLDTVETVDIAHIHGGEPVEGPAVVKHRIHAMTNDVPVWEDGRHGRGPDARGVRRRLRRGHRLPRRRRLPGVPLPPPGDRHAAPPPPGRAPGDQPGRGLPAVVLHPHAGHGPGRHLHLRAAGRRRGRRRPPRVRGRPHPLPPRRPPRRRRHRRTGRLPAHRRVRRQGRRAPPVRLLAVVPVRGRGRGHRHPGRARGAADGARRHHRAGCAPAGGRGRPGGDAGDGRRAGVPPRRGGGGRPAPRAHRPPPPDGEVAELDLAL